MYSKKQKIALIIATTLSFIFALSLYLEGKVRISEYHQHMLYEIHIHYEEKIDDLVKMSGLSLKIISTFLQPYVKNLPERESKPLQELLLMHQKELGDLALNEEGMTHLSIYSLSGELLLDLVEHQEGHKHSSLGHNILLQHAIQTHKITYGYDYDAELHGFKYIAPLSINSSIIGYIEIAIPFDVILKDIDTTLTSQSLILYKKEVIHSSSPHDFSDIPSNAHYSIEKNYLPLFSNLEINGLFTDSLIKTMMNEDGMVYTKIKSNMQSYCKIAYEMRKI